MMKHFILSIPTILIILQSCNPVVNDVTPDEIAKKIFTRTELEGIGQMIHFVDSIVSAKTGHTGINESYRAYFDKLNADILSEKGFTPLLNDTTRFKFFETMDSEAFSAIWREGVEHLIGSSQSRKIVDLDLEGKYMKYLQEIGKSDNRYAIIHKDIYMQGAVSPSMTAWLLKNRNELDFTVYKHRLWATVFLLRVAEPIEIPVTINGSVELSMETNVFDLSALPDRIEVKMTNNTNDTIWTGEHYRIEIFDNGKWREISFPEYIIHNDTSYALIFNDIDYMLKPSASINLEKNLFKDWIFYSKGRYRIAQKYIKSDFRETREEYKAYAEFHIE